MIWILIQIGVGGGSVWFGGVAFGGGMKAKLVWRYHRVSGYILCGLLLLTVNLGGSSGWANKYIDAWIVRFFAYTLAPLMTFVAIATRTRSVLGQSLRVAATSN